MGLVLKWMYYVDILIRSKYEYIEVLLLGHLGYQDAFSLSSCIYIISLSWNENPRTLSSL